MNASMPELYRGEESRRQVAGPRGVCYEGVLPRRGKRLQLVYATHTSPNQELSWRYAEEPSMRMREKERGGLLPLRFSAWVHALASAQPTMCACCPGGSGVGDAGGSEFNRRPAAKVGGGLLAHHGVVVLEKVPVRVCVAARRAKR